MYQTLKIDIFPIPPPLFVNEIRALWLFFHIQYTHLWDHLGNAPNRIKHRHTPIRVGLVTSVYYHLCNYLTRADSTQLSQLEI